MTWTNAFDASMPVATMSAWSPLRLVPSTATRASFSVGTPAVSTTERARRRPGTTC